MGEKDFRTETFTMQLLSKHWIVMYEVKWGKVLNEHNSVDKLILFPCFYTRTGTVVMINVLVELKHSLSLLCM